MDIRIRSSKHDASASRTFDESSSVARLHSNRSLALWRKLHPFIVLMALLLAFVSSVGGQAQPLVGLLERGDSIIVENGLRIPVAILVQVADSADNTIGYRTMIAPPMKATYLAHTTVGRAYLHRLEPVHPAVSRSGKAPSCSERLDPATLAAAIDSLKVEVNRLNIAESPEAIVAIAAASHLAQLEHEQRLDEINTKRRIVELSGADHSNYYGRVIDNKEQSEAATEQLIGAAVSLAVMFSDKERVRESIIRQELVGLEEIAVQAESALVVMRSGFAAARLEIAAAVSFQRMLDSALALPPVVLGGPVAVERPCPAAPAVEEPIVLRGEWSVVTFRARIRFDRGGTFPLIFRRIGHLDAWVGLLPWPMEAKSARVEGIQGLSGRSATVPLTRLRMNELFARAERRIGDIRRRAQETRFRSQGGDRLRTLPVPE